MGRSLGEEGADPRSSAAGRQRPALLISGVAFQRRVRVMKVLAADGYILCCGLLRTLMVTHKDVFVTAANSIDEVLVRIAELPDFDLVLLDASMPGMENFAGLRQTVEKLPNVPVSVTSPTENRAHIIAAIRNGARGYIPLSAKPCVLQHALPLIMAGEFYIPASALRVGNGHALLASDGPEARVPGVGDALTPRQHEITVMLADGKSNKEIARALKLLEGTVKLHVKGILRKLGVRNRTEAVLAAARAGYLPKGVLEMAPSRSHDTAKGADKTPAEGTSPPALRYEAPHAERATARAAAAGRNGLR
jgi:two-component system, NarL family, nitrate/nitrite response regulator NarL